MLVFSWLCSCCETDTVPEGCVGSACMVNSQKGGTADLPGAPNESATPIIQDIDPGSPARHGHCCSESRPLAWPAPFPNTRARARSVQFTRWRWWPKLSGNLRDRACLLVSARLCSVVDDIKGRHPAHSTPEKEFYYSPVNEADDPGSHGVHQHWRGERR